MDKGGGSKQLKYHARGCKFDLNDHPCSDGQEGGREDQKTKLMKAFVRSALPPILPAYLPAPLPPVGVAPHLFHCCPQMLGAILLMMILPDRSMLPAISFSFSTFD
eukprot:766677-Hanusia_phi.AAC.6